MKKLRVIATCLTGFWGDEYEIKQAELTVRETYFKEFPGKDYRRWNSDLDGAFARAFIREHERISRTEVRKYIELLWDK